MPGRSRESEIPNDATLVRSLGSVLLLLALGCAHGDGIARDTSEDARAAIAAASRAFSDAYVRNDMNTLGNLYTADAVLLPPDREIRGREAIMKYFEWGPRFRQIAHRMEASEIVVEGHIAVDTGLWHSMNVRGDNPKTTASGRYLIVWIRESDGEWRMRYDMWHRASAPQM